LTDSDFRMKSPLITAVCFSLAVLLVGTSATLGAAPEEATQTTSRDSVRLAQVNTPKRRFAEGVVTTIPMKYSADDTYSSPEQYKEIVQGIPNLKWTPNYLTPTRTLEAKASEVIFRRDIWGLEFAFKPVRMIHVEVPQPTGGLEKKLIWYMVYRVTNYGEPLRRVPVKDEFDNIKYEVQNVEGLPSSPIRFIPKFVLESKNRKKQYLDRIIPTAIDQIARRETGGSKLYNSVEIGRFDIPVTTDDQDQGIWGVVTWEDIDPETDFFSIYIQGLTNAYRWKDKSETVAPGDRPLAQREFQQKTLQLNFWRPGDDRDENEREIRFGIPGELDYEWIFR